MYVKVMLTILVAVSAFIAVRLAFPPSSPPLVGQAPGVADAALDAKIDSLELDAVPASQAVQVIEQKAGIHILVDWNSLGSQSVSRNTPVTLSLHNVVVADALSCALQADGKDWQLTCNTWGDTANIYVLDRIPTLQTSVRVYDVRDLLSDEYWGIKSGPEESQPNQTQRMDSLAGMLTAYAGLDGWKPSAHFSGGQSAIVKTETHGFAGRIIVTQTTHGHRRVQELLAWLRQMR
jgi:hypothetical protein